MLYLAKTHKTMRNLISVLFLALFFTSCVKKNTPKSVENALNLAGENKKELQAVLNSYAKEDINGSKLRAAEYLISSMPKYKSSYDEGYYEEIFNRVEKERIHYENNSDLKIVAIRDKTNAIFKNLLDSVSGPRMAKTISDLHFIDSTFLVENIELAFKAYEANPIKSCKDFNDFLKFVLPYRTGSEPLEKGKRLALFLKNKWALEALKTTPVDTVVKKIYEEMKFSIQWGKKNHFPNTPNLSQIEQVRFGSCDQLSNYVVNALRAIGIPAGVDYTTRWGNRHKSAGHSWIFYFTETGYSSINIGTPEFELVNNIYTISSLTKVFRRSYSEREDITHLYKKAYDVDTVSYTHLTLPTICSV